MRIKLVVAILISFMLITCVEFEPVSPIPAIEYKNLDFEMQFDSSLENNVLTGVIEFSFIDGDADLGVFQEVSNDTLLPDSVKYGLFVDIYEKVEGEYEKIYLVESIKKFPFLDTLNLHSELPYDQKLDRVGQNKTVKGIIRSGIVFLKKPLYDTMMLEFFIRDRALNKSNIERTRDFSAHEIDSVLNLQ